MAIVSKPPDPVPEVPNARYVFLAGSIDMGVAEDWQAVFEAALADREDLVILNPRREQWDSSWQQALSDARFVGQVEWELAGIERADVVAMYLHPATKAPVSLLELGLVAQQGKLVVLCPEGYHRKGNVDVVCRRYGVEQADSFDDLVARVRRRLGR